MRGAQHKPTRRWRTDWFRVLVDLQYAGWPHARVADHLAIPRPTLHGWKAGSEPPHCDGVRLLRLWAEVTGTDIDDRPMTDWR